MTFDDEARRAIATGWDPHAQTMKEYARSVGVSERAVRKYRARFSAEAQQTVPAARASVPLLEAVDAVQARLAALEAGVDAALASVAALRAALDAVRGETEGTETLQPAAVEAVPPSPSMATQPAAVPVPIPRPGVFW